ncbi:MAG: UDP-N-acetylglucosamine 2-epimerase [Candidatus Nitrosocosmicus sp.]|nr:UDP-N-acetylglucosamine 2-epimerase [Candidatus Nitrosocosmicus sp.]MDN5867586.1 UDP-N-acetylglucosamine 2-epimerase [Candidatus Nitrosocosmicus sp.]
MGNIKDKKKILKAQDKSERSPFKNIEEIALDPKFLPYVIYNNNLDDMLTKYSNFDKIMAIVIGTKPDFYKQAPVLIESVKQGLPSFIISTGQHYDELLGYGIKEFELDNFIACDLQIRGDLIQKSSDLMLKFGHFGRHLRTRLPGKNLLPIVHGDTLVAGIATLSWVFGMGQKVGQNEAGLRSMSPSSIKGIKINSFPSDLDVENFITDQISKKWFITREEPFPEQIDTWICSSGTKFFFAPTKLNKDHLLREGYPEEDIYVVGNTVVDAIGLKRRNKPNQSIFDIYPKLESGSWIRMDIHRRENLTTHRFNAIIGGLVDLIKGTDFKVVLVLLNGTISALNKYDLHSKLLNLEEEFPDKFLITNLWKEYGHVIEFLDSGKCWAEITDSGSMQEELLYFPNVCSFTVRFNTDRPETVFDAKGNLLIPPINRNWLPKMVSCVNKKYEDLGFKFKSKEKIYGQPGQVSQKIVRLMKKEFEKKEGNFFPWLHQRLNFWHEDDEFDFL